MLKWETERESVWKPDVDRTAGAAGTLERLLPVFEVAMRETGAG
jgi:hypothetical protein